MIKLTKKQMNQSLQKVAESIDSGNIVMTHWPIVARAIEAEVLRINGRWIPVSERMPDPDTGEVLVWLTGGRCAFDEWHMHREDPTGMGGPTMEMSLMWRDYDFDEITHWMRLPAAPGDHIGDANKMVERRQLIEIEQRARLRERFKDRVPSPATADFDLPVACSDDATPRATGCPDTMDDTGHFAEVDMPAFLRKQNPA